MRRDAWIGLMVGGAILATGVAYWQWRDRPLSPPPGTTAIAPTAAPPAATTARVASPGATTAPTGPSTPPAAPAESKGPSFDVVRVNPAGEAVIAGRAEPGAEVTVLDGEKPLGRVTADNRGEWVLLPSAPLPSGQHQLSLSERGAAGAVEKSQGVVAMVVPEHPGAMVAPEHPSAAAPAASAQESVALLVPRQGTSAAVPLQLPRLTGGHRRLALDVIQYNAAGDVVLLGRALPEVGIEIELDDKAAGSGVASSAGAWTVPLRQSLPEGKYRIHINARDKRGALVASLSVTFTRVAPPPGAVAVDIQPGNNLWRIAQHSYGDGLRYTEIVQANRVQIHDPNVIYPGQVFAVPGK